MVKALGATATLVSVYKISYSGRLSDLDQDSRIETIQVKAIVIFMTEKESYKGKDRIRIQEESSANNK